MKAWHWVALVLALFECGFARAAEPLEIHVIAGQNLLTAKAPDGKGVVEHVLNAWRDPASWRLVPHPVDSFEQFRQMVARLPSDAAHPSISVAMLTTRMLDAAVGGQMLAVAGGTQPFDGIDETLKGRDTLHRDRVVWLPLGWVLWSSFEAIRPPGACAPGFAWSTCIEQIGAENYLIGQRAGDAGWPLYGAAILRPWSKAGPVKTAASNPDADALMDWLGNAAASAAMRQDFVIVPHPDVRPRRSVVFKLFDLDGTELAASYDSPHPLPRPTVDAVTGTFNACGRAVTCPNYLAPAGTEAAMRARVSKALDAR